MKRNNAKKVVTSVISAIMVFTSGTTGIQIHAMEKTDIDNTKGTPELLPVPQSSAFTGKVLNVTKSVNIEGKATADPVALNDLLEFLESKNITVNETSVKGDTTFYIGEADDNVAAIEAIKDQLGMKDADVFGEEGYVLDVDADAVEGGSVVLEGSGGDGTFYAVQTLKQLFDGTSVSEADIEDEPTMETRGTIEGFYGTPWSHQDRLNQIDFYGDMKLNTYIYAPKDDPYHREQWRELYDADAMKKMEELIQKAEENKVDFVFSLSPGLDIRFDGENGEADYQALVTKCQSLYDKGVRSFALFFDDIKNNDGIKQAEVLNRFNEEFIQANEGVKPLITVPTEYNTLAMGIGSGVNKYTQDFAATLDPSIKVLWTGSAVVPEGIDVSNAQQVKQVYGDRIGIWWNYPCTDYISDKLGLGPIYGLDKGLANELDFLVMNPMEHADLSEITLSTGADYAWNTDAYDYNRSFSSAIDILYGDLAPYMYTFANHSSRLIAGWASTGRGDAPEIRTLMDETMKNLAKGVDATEGIDVLNKEFDQMVEAATKLKQELPANVLSHCSGNLDKLKALGENDKIALALLVEKNQDHPDQAKISELTTQLNSAMYSLNYGKKVSELTALAFISEVLNYSIEPVAAFAVSSTFATPGTQIQLTNQSSLSSTDLEWRAPGATISSTTEENPVISYAKEGIYTVSLVAKNKHGQDEVIKENLITISNSADEEKSNLALNKTASASDYTVASETPAKAIDGISTTKWCTTNGGSQWIEIDLGKEMTITDIAISHAEIGGEGSSLNTKAYHIAISSNQSDYKEVVKVTDNSAGLTEDAIPVTVGRYVKLFVDTPTQGGDRAARIYEIAVNGLDHAITMPPVFTEADKTALNEQVAKAVNYQEDVYTTDSYAVLAAAIQDAQALIVDETATQGDIDAAVTALQTAMDQLTRRAEQWLLDSFKEHVDTYHALSEDYTEEEFAHMAALLDEADVLLAKDPANLSTKEISALDLKLIDAARELNVTADTNALMENLKLAITSANHILESSVMEDVRPGKADDLRKAVAAGQALVKAQSQDQEALKQAVTDIIKAAQELWQIVDKTPLMNLLDVAETKLDQDYTEESLNALKEAMTAAEAILNDDATEAQVKEVYTNLADALASLVKNEAVNKEALLAQIAIADQIMANIKDYVPSTVAGLDTILAEAKVIYHDETATQEAVNTICDALTRANMKARTLADKSALEQVIAEATAIDESLYTAKSVALLKAAVNEGMAVYGNAEASKAEVDEATAKIEAAMKALEKSTSVEPKPDGNGSGDDTTSPAPEQPSNQTGGASTGDTTNTGTIGMLGMIGLIGMWFSRKLKKENVDQ